MICQAIQILCTLQWGLVCWPGFDDQFYSGSYPENLDYSAFVFPPLHGTGSHEIIKKGEALIEIVMSSLATR